MKIKLLTRLVFGCALLAAACFPHRIVDYNFFVFGTVATEDGAPLEGVEVVLQVESPIYEALTPVTTKRLVTSDDKFFFGGLTSNPSTKYTVTVHKEGFEPQTVSGSAPPNGEYHVRLKRAVGKGSTGPGSK
jgi:hypothetical protein